MEYLKVSDISEKWNTYSYNFPVPLNDDKYPYVARATMCYFPTCNRAQGVDYTNTELNIHFGRIKDDGKIFTEVDIFNHTVYHERLCQQSAERAKTGLGIKYKACRNHNS